ncbi:glycosyltransferase [Georgenia alba]|uniref:Glycosyltransferase n=1 Tax=Georgenia alba TaxID=2233858 RepID=A0ABW2Q1U9_9MICO
MRVLIATSGTRGDVVPFLGVGQRLQAAGHEVTIGVHDSHAGLVTAAGLGHRSIGGDMEALLDDEQRTGGRGATPRGVSQSVRLARQFLRELGEGLVDAAGTGTDVLLLASSTAPLGWHVAQALDVPSAGLYLQPLEPTREFSPIWLTPRPFGATGNLALGHAASVVIDAATSAAVRELRDRLGLPRMSIREVRRVQAEDRWPILHGISPSIVPRPADWRDGLDVVGYWFSPPEPAWTPPADLVEFLDAGPPPVLVTLGSMATGRIDRLVRHAVVALRRAGVRGILQGVDALPDDGEDIITAGVVPHEWLLPRVAAVVHHAGAGTTAAALRAGVPTVPVPVLSDQPFWSARAVSLGVAPGVVPLRRMCTDRLTEAIHTVTTDPRYRRRATAFADRVRRDDGAAPVLDLVDALAA